TSSTRSARKPRRPDRRDPSAPPRTLYPVVARSEECFCGGFSGRGDARLPEVPMEDSPAHRRHPPLVVFLPGLFGSATDFSRVRDRAPPRFPVLAPVLPIASGAAAGPPLETVSGLVAHVQSGIREQGAPRVVLVGNSLGGHIALSLALAMPEQVAGMVLSGSSGLFERGFEECVPRQPTREWVQR